MNQTENIKEPKCIKEIILAALSSLAVVIFTRYFTVDEIMYVIVYSLIWLLFFILFLYLYVMVPINLKKGTKDNEPS